MIFLVIPVYNRKRYTLACLTSLTRQTITEHRVVVVDDGSTDGTAEAIYEQFPDVTVLTGNGSLWWAGATNLGIRHVQESVGLTVNDFILTLNDDTEVPPDYLATLLTTYAAHQPCVVGSVSVDINNKNRLIYAGTRLNLWFPKIENWAETRYQNNYARLLADPNPVLSDCLPGRGMLIPQAVFAKIGLLDAARFRHHMADIDFSLSARKAGFPSVISPASVVYEHTDTTGVVLADLHSWTQFRQALVSIKSPINYPVRYAFARKHSPLSYLYFGLDMTRIVGGQLRRQLGVTPSLRP